VGQCCVLTCQSIPLVNLDCDQTLGARHLHCGIDSVDDSHEFQEERPPQDAVVTDVDVGRLKCQHLSTFVVSCPTSYLKINSPNGGGRLSQDNTMERVLHRGQIFQIEAHLNEGFPHDEI
jgi:hypothetical protein